MKLFLAFLVITLIILITIPAYSPDKGQAFSLPASGEIPSLAHPSDLTSGASLSPDSLQKLFDRAVWNNDIIAQKELIKSGIDINKINREDGYAAIHWAVERRLIQTVNVLLENGAEIDIFTSNAIGNDRTALHIAAELGHADIVQRLLAQGADPNKKTIFDESPLHGVRMYVRNQEVVQLLIDYGAEVNAVTVFDTTPLHAASLLGAANIASLLIEHGAVVDMPDKRGMTPLHHAAQQGHNDVVLQLIKANAQIDAQARTGDTAMHLAAKKGHTDVVRMLLKQGANPLKLNNFSKSPLTEAQERAYDHLVEMLSSTLTTEIEA